MVAVPMASMSLRSCGPHLIWKYESLLLLVPGNYCCWSWREWTRHHDSSSTKLLPAFSVKKDAQFSASMRRNLTVSMAAVMNFCSSIQEEHISGSEILIKQTMMIRWPLCITPCTREGHCKQKRNPYIDVQCIMAEAEKLMTQGQEGDEDEFAELLLSLMWDVGWCDVGFIKV